MDNRKLKNILTRIDALESKDPEVAAILKSIMDCIDELDDNVDELFDSVDELNSDLDEVYDSLDDMDETIDDVLDYLGDECDGNCGECEDRDACEDSDCCCDDCADDESGDDEEAEDDEDDDDYGTLDCEYDEENDMLSIACPYCEHEIFFQIEDDDVKMGGMELHCDNCDKDIAISFEMDEDGCCCGDDDCDCEGEADDCDDHGKCCGHSHRHDHD